MAYCRFSYESDVYVYESAQGWELHVASNRHTSEAPFPGFKAEWSAQEIPELVARYKAQAEWYANAKLVPIGLEHAGKSYTYDTPQECAVSLGFLRDLGYTVPEHVIETLMTEEAV